MSNKIINERINSLINDNDSCDALATLRNCCEEYKLFPEEESKLCEFSELFRYINCITFNEFTNIIYFSEDGLPANISKLLNDFLNLMNISKKMAVANN